MRSIRWISGIVLGGALTWACTTESPQGPSQFITSTLAGEVAGCETNPPSGFTLRWDCDELNIPVWGTATFEDSIRPVFGQWRDALDIPIVGENYPKFGWTTDSSAARVVIEVIGSADE
jgi:hypothetical protein